MAKLHELTTGFIESFLRNNPKSLVDSNGFLRSEYEAEIARRAQPVTEPLGVPDPRTYRPQFECTGEALPEFETPDEQLGIDVEAQLTAPIIVSVETPIQLADITPEQGEQIHSEIDKGWEAQPKPRKPAKARKKKAKTVAESAEGELHSGPDGADEHNDHE